MLLVTVHLQHLILRLDPLVVFETDCTGDGDWAGLRMVGRFGVVL
jgi:hypothetical protein